MSGQTCAGAGVIYIINQRGFTCRTWRRQTEGRQVGPKFILLHCMIAAGTRVTVTFIAIKLWRAESLPVMLFWFNSLNLFTDSAVTSTKQFNLEDLPPPGCSFRTLSHAHHVRRSLFSIIFTPSYVPIALSSSAFCISHTLSDKIQCLWRTRIYRIYSLWYSHVTVMS